ncbi:MAG TPA: hypothetical protein DHU75_06195 [Rikenellaceae bacterium]|nr:hypothetical protein [Rikenellaceae bacterium]
MIQGITSSGLRYFVKHADGKAACAAISIKCGTREEGSLPEGIAHLVEHCIFKGTKHRSANNISTCLDKLGGELNAYTTKEEIVLHATVLKEDLDKAIKLLLEIATQATFPEDEIEIEKGVVLDEIISYKDSPAEDIYDTFESLFFEGYPLGKLTLGTIESIKKAGRTDLIQYYNSHFVPTNMVLSIVADIDEKLYAKKVVSLCEKRLTETTCTQSAENTTSIKPHTFNATEKKSNHEANLVIGALAPSLYDNNRLCCVLLCNILGGPASNSMLNSILREKHGWVYSAECNYSQYSDAGLVTISIGCDKENISRCTRAIFSIIKRLQNKPLSDTALKTAKKQLFGQLAISSDSKESQALSAGKSILAFGKVFTDKENIKLINDISSEDLQRLAQSLWAEGNYSQLLYI